MSTGRADRIISYHDTWISVDPIRGCPYGCAYCILRDSGDTGVRPTRTTSPDACVEQLLEYPLFVRGFTPLAIGNNTDIFHPLNVEYLLELLAKMASVPLDNPITLATKAPLTVSVLERMRAIPGLRIVLFLSYSGLGTRFEPNFTDEQLRANFAVAKSLGFPVVHYWRPLLPENTSPEAIRRMLAFAKYAADATVFIGLKLHPQLTQVITRDSCIDVPVHLREQRGEWLDPQTVELIYHEASSICPDHPLYRHASCALAAVLGQPNHTATMYRADICPPSQCSPEQRGICDRSRRIPVDSEIRKTLSLLGREIRFECLPDRIAIRAEVTQDEFVFLLHNLKCPLEVTGLRMLRLYHGSIFEGQRIVGSGPKY